MQPRFLPPALADDDDSHTTHPHCAQNDAHRAGSECMWLLPSRGCVETGIFVICLCLDRYVCNALKTCIKYVTSRTRNERGETLDINMCVETLTCVWCLDYTTFDITHLTCVWCLDDIHTHLTCVWCLDVYCGLLSPVYMRHSSEASHIRLLRSTVSLVLRIACTASLLHSYRVFGVGWKV